MADKIQSQEAYNPEQGLPDATQQDSRKNTGNVIGGLKAAINNPDVSEEAKEADKAKLESLEK